MFYIYISLISVTGYVHIQMCNIAVLQYCYKKWEPITFDIIDVKPAVAQFAVLYLNIITTWVNDDRNVLYE